MELGVRAEMNTAAVPRAGAASSGCASRGEAPFAGGPCADARQRAITEHILALADRAGDGAALIDAAGAVTTWRQFADTVRAAARGLSRRGLQDTDAAGVLAGDAVSHALAIHAIRAAGASAAPIHPADPGAGPVPDIAAQLKQSRARMLITSAAQAEVAIQAAERSWVRQVFAFGDAEGTMPFSDLLEPARHGHRGGLRLNGHAEAAADSAAAPIPGLAGPAPRLTSRDVVVAGPPCGRGGTYTSLLDLALSAGATIVAAPLDQLTSAVRAYGGTAAIVPAGTDVPVLPAERILTVA